MIITKLTIEQLKQFLNALHEVAKERQGITWRKLIEQGVTESVLDTLTSERYINRPVEEPGKSYLDMQMFIPWKKNELWPYKTISVLEDYVASEQDLEARVIRLQQELEEFKEYVRTKLNQLG